MPVQFNSQEIIQYNTSQGTSAASSANTANSDESIFTSSSGSSSGEISMASVFNYSSDKASKAKTLVEDEKKKQAQAQKEVKKIENQIAKEEDESKISDLKIKLFSLKSKLRTATSNVSAAVNNFTRAQREETEYNPDFNIGSPTASNYNTDSTNSLGRQEGPIQPAAGNYGQYGYNEQRGADLANSALNVDGTTGWCYRGVINSLKKVGVTGLTGGSAYMAADQLAKRSDFVEVPKGAVSKDELKNLPAGAVVVWGKGDTENTKHGHISISLGDGRESSDHITAQYQSCGNGTYRIFLPA